MSNGMSKSLGESARSMSGRKSSKKSSIKKQIIQADDVFPEDASSARHSSKRSITQSNRTEQAKSELPQSKGSNKKNSRSERVIDASELKKSQKKGEEDGKNLTEGDHTIKNEDMDGDTFKDDEMLDRPMDIRTDQDGMGDQMERDIDDMDGAMIISPTNANSMPAKEMEKTQTYSSMDKTGKEGGAPSATDNGSMAQGHLHQTSR